MGGIDDGFFALRLLALLPALLLCIMSVVDALAIDGLIRLWPWPVLPVAKPAPIIIIIIPQRIESLVKKREAAAQQLREQEEAAKQVETRVLLLEERGKSLAEKKRSLGQVRDGVWFGGFGIWDVF